jgi:hypothetical protein
MNEEDLVKEHPDWFEEPVNYSNIINVYRPILGSQIISYTTDWHSLGLIDPIKCELCNKETICVHKNQKTGEIKNVCLNCFDTKKKYAISSHTTIVGRNKNE